MKILYSFIAVVALVLLAWLGAGVAQLSVFFGVVIPYAAAIIFIAGVVYRVLKWARSPVPFRIPTTCGQQKSLPWIKSSYLESPHNTLGVIGRMALEILTFRSLFRNTKAELKEGPRLVYGADKFLWAGALAFHYAFLVIFLRHYRFFAEPVPAFVTLVQNLDGFFQVGVPALYVTNIVIIAALGYLFLRRLANPQVRYISLAADYFALFLLLGVAASGILMRYFYKVDIVAVKEMVMGLMGLNPTVPAGVGAIFYVHLFLVSVLWAYFPFSKLMHMAGVFLSPTRNLANNNRMVRHINPWNPPVKVHTYEEWEDEFRDLMKHAKYPPEAFEKE